MKKTIQMSILSLTLAAACLLGCNEPEMKPVETILEYSIIDGDTVRTEILSQDKINAFSKMLPGINIVTTGTIITASNPVLPKNNGEPKGIEKLKNPNLGQHPLRYIAVGSSLTAGFRDGGYFNDGIATSFPAILAEALKISNFRQPKFDNSEYNGFGRNTKTDFNPTNGPVQKYARSTNNLAIQGVGDGVRPSTIKGDFEDFDNLGIPSLDMWRIHWPARANAPLLQTQRFPSWEILEGQRIGPVSLSGPKPFADKIKNIEADFFTIEFLSTFIDTWAGNYSSSSYTSYDPPIPPLLDLLNSMQDKGMKGCILNIPDPVKLPGILQITDKDFYYDQLYTITQNLSLNKKEFLSDDYIILPTSGSDSIISKNVNIAFKNARQSDIRSKSDIRYIINYNNQYLEEFARSSEYPIVDIKKLYENILDGKFITHDGVKVDGSLTGNFFSSDGLYPSPFGNAVIANEVIRTINAFYKTEIPLIATREYLLGL